MTLVMKERKTSINFKSKILSLKPKVKIFNEKKIIIALPQKKKLRVTKINKFKKN